jgi:hypothetical protein
MHQGRKGLLPWYHPGSPSRSDEALCSCNGLARPRLLHFASAQQLEGDLQRIGANGLSAGDPYSLAQEIRLLFPVIAFSGYALRASVAESVGPRQSLEKHILSIKNFACTTYAFVLD